MPIVCVLHTTLPVAQTAQGGKNIIFAILILGTILAFGRREVARA